MTLATAEPFKAPQVASLSVRVVVDSFFDQFMPKATHPHVAIEHVSRIRGRETTTLAGEWGLSLHLESKSAGAGGQYLLDFGYTPEILLRNFDLLGIVPERLDGLILSHAHRDHYGGMVGFVEHHRRRMRDDLKLFAGGDSVFREKWLGSRDEEPRSWGALDAAALEAARVETVACEHAHALAGPFTSGRIDRQSFERVLPNTLPGLNLVRFIDDKVGYLAGDGCDQHPSGVFVSTDGGASWTSMNVGLMNSAVNALVRAPGPSGALYAATNGAGVFVFSTELENRAPVKRVGGRRSPRVVRLP